MFEGLGQKRTQFHNPNHKCKLVRGCSAINTNTIGTANKMTLNNLLGIVEDYGWEVLSHGHDHLGLGRHTTTAQSESTSINVKWAGMIKPGMGYDYQIWNGTTSEVLNIDNVNAPGGSYGDGTINLYTPLVNVYPSGSFISLTDASIHKLLGDCVNHIVAWGLTTQGHVYTWHAGSQDAPNPLATTFVSSYFEHGRGQDTAHNNQNSPVLNLHSQLINDSTTLESIDDLLNFNAENDCVTIFYGHGETNTALLAKWEYIVNGAFNRGIKILTRSESIEYL